MRRPDPRRLPFRGDASGLTGVAGLVPFGQFVRELGVDQRLRGFDALKSGPGVVYPMHAQLRLLIDTNVVGETRIFGVESLASDPLLAHLAGGSLPSIDVLYDDLARMTDLDIAVLEQMVTEHGLSVLRGVKKPKVVHLDVDTTVEPLFGQQEGALPGPNPRYHGRPSYHPILCYCPEAKSVVGAMLRPGDTGLGGMDSANIQRWIRQVRRTVGPACAIYVRIDAAGDCTQLLKAISDEGAFFVVKAKMTRDLMTAIGGHREWETVETDLADGSATLQAATIEFRRAEWDALGLNARVAAVRTRERFTGKQIALWDDLELTAQAYITNDRVNPPDVIARKYDFRAGIEPEIAELKNGWGIGKVPSKHFNANHALFLIKLLSFNLMRRFAESVAPSIRHWRVAWLRRVLINRPGRLTRSARRLAVHAALPALRPT